MANPYVCCLVAVEDIDGRALSVGVDYDTVTIGEYRLPADAAEDFAQALVAACWRAGRNAQRMEQEAADA